MPESDELKVRFVENLSYTCEGLCLYWVKEIHIDKAHEGKPEAEDLIRHEKRHYQFFLRMLESQGGFKGMCKQLFWLFANNIWDTLDCFRLALRFPRAFLSVLITDFVILGLVIYAILRYFGIGV